MHEITEPVTRWRFLTLESLPSCSLPAAAVTGVSPQCRTSSHEVTADTPNNKKTPAHETLALRVPRACSAAGLRFAQPLRGKSSSHWIPAQTEAPAASLRPATARASRWQSHSAEPQLGETRVAVGWVGVEGVYSAGLRCRRAVVVSSPFSSKSLTLSSYPPLSPCTLDFIGICFQKMLYPLLLRLLSLNPLQHTLTPLPVFGSLNFLQASRKDGKKWKGSGSIRWGLCENGGSQGRAVEMKVTWPLWVSEQCRAEPPTRGWMSWIGSSILRSFHSAQALTVGTLHSQQWPNALKLFSFFSCKSPQPWLGSSSCEAENTHSCSFWFLLLYFLSLFLIPYFCSFLKLLILILNPVILGLSPQHAATNSLFYTNMWAKTQPTHKTWDF